MNIHKIFKTFSNVYKEDIIEIINNNFEDNRMDDLIEWMEDDIEHNGSISELADSYIDVYYYDLRVWAVDNYEYIEDAMDEFGMPEKFDFHKAIQQGQYVKYQEDIYECISNMIEHIKENYKV